MQNVLFNKYKEISKSTSDSDFYKKNTMDFYNLYNNPDNDRVRPVSISNISIGRFYFIKYLDKSNWMQYSPVMVADFRDKRMVFAVNFNFIPLEVRMGIYNKLIEKLEYEKGENPLSFLNFEKTYKLFIRHGYEYAIVEYEISRIEALYEINFNNMLEFLFSGYPSNKYDPIKLYDIWVKKLETKEKRHQEMIATLASDFYNVTDELIESADALKGHFKRLKSNYEEYGDKFDES